MSHETLNAVEMKRKRGYTARKPAPAQHDGNDQPTDPSEPQVSVILLRGWWPAEGTIYSTVDEHGNWAEEQAFTTPTMPDGSPNEMARKRMKLGPDTRVVVPYSIGKRLVNEGKALHDRNM